MTLPRNFHRTEFHSQHLSSDLVSSDCAESALDCEKSLWDEGLSIKPSSLLSSIAYMSRLPHL